MRITDQGEPDLSEKNNVTQYLLSINTPSQMKLQLRYNYFGTSKTVTFINESIKAITSSTIYASRDNTI